MFTFFCSKKSTDESKTNQLETVKSCAPWHSLSKATRLNFLGTITSIVDTAMGVATKNAAINEFFKTCLPFSISFYLIPSLISIIATLSCQEKAPSAKKMTYSQDAKELLDTLTIDDDEFRDFLTKHPKEINRLLARIKLYQEKDSTDNVDIIINTIYFIVRAVRGGIPLLALFNLTTESTKNSITDVATGSYSICYIGYLGFMLAHHLYKSHIKVKHYSKIHGLFLTEEPDPTMELDTISIELASNSDKGSEYTLLTSHPQRLEATRSKWHSTITLR